MAALSRTIRCERCNTILAQQLGPAYAHMWALKRKGQEVVVAQLIAVRCECGQPWRPDVPTPYPTLEVKAGA